MAKAKEMATGVVVASEVVEWSALRRGKGGAESVSEGRLDRVVAGDVDPEDAEPEQTAEIEALKAPVVLALPSSQLLVRVLELPPVDGAEIAGVVELQVDKFSPFPLDQMVVSHEVLARDETTCIVLVAAAKATVVDAAGAYLEQHGLRISRVDAALLGRWKGLVEIGELADSGRETLIIVSEGTLEVLTHEAGTLVELSCLGAIPDLSDAAAAEDMAGEIAHLLVATEVERGRAKEQRITLWAETALPIFARALETVCEVAVHEASLTAIPSVAHGVALRDMAGGSVLDLTPSQWRAAESTKRLRRQLVVSALVVVGAWGILVGGVLGWMAFERNRLSHFKADAERWQEPANAVRRLRLQVRMIERYTDRTYSALECLRDISRLQPEGVDLTTFTYRKSEGVAIDGEADSGTFVNAFHEALNGSALFSDVQSGARTVTRKGRHRFSFDMAFPEDSL